MVTDPEQANGTSASQANSDQRNALALLGSAPLATFGTITRGEEQTACRAVALTFSEEIAPIEARSFQSLARRGTTARHPRRARTASADERCTRCRQRGCANR